MGRLDHTSPQEQVTEGNETHTRKGDEVVGKLRQLRIRPPALDSQVVTGTFRSLPT